ncbi:hypothetical protein HanRHA438_Chr16g0744551 [Helianthus annuus]|nr:hypothetical protein HanRHA438_Chr16g0744551 [Helianthus annuus]
MLSMNTSRFVVHVSQSFRFFHLWIRSFPQFPYPLPFEFVIQPFRHQFIVQIIFISIIIALICILWIIFTVNQITIVDYLMDVIDFICVFNFL